MNSYEGKAKESIAIEEDRVQEKIVLLSISTENISGTEYLKAILINNTGIIITRIRAIYIDSNFICDPADETLNPGDTYINPKDSLWIQLPPNLTYNPISKIEATTERGIGTIEYEWKLKSGSQAETPPETIRTNFGPLLLNFEEFYYAENDRSYDPNAWEPGWSVENGLTVVWNVTVTNIDDRDITINKYSSFTIVSNDGGVQKPWFIEPPNGMDTLLIPSNTTDPEGSTVHLIYIWDRPRMTQGVSNQSVYNQNDRSKVFLTFFGIFHEHDGSTKPYGQTIPFEAVLIRDPQMTISASPTVLAAGSAMTSTITVTVRDITGILAPDVTVNFATTLGTLNSPTATTNAVGVAAVRLSPGASLGVATVTASWGTVSKSINITIALGTLTLTANPTVVAAGSTMTSTITSRVTLNGNPIQGETVQFTADLGNVSPTAVTNSQGYATATFTPGMTAGIATITSTWGVLTRTVQVNIFNNIAVTPTTSSITAGATVTYTATASDGLGHNWPITNQVTWSIDNGAGGFWNGATYTSETVGAWTVRAALGGFIGTASLTVNHASLSSITVDPSTSTLTAGQSQAYTAIAHDLYGNTWSITPLVTWSIDESGHGGTWIQSTATYTSAKSGIWTARATQGAISGTSSLTVNPAAASTLTVSGFPTPATAGAAATVTVTAVDSYGNTATSYVGTTRLTSTDSQAVLPEDYAFTPGDLGTKVFMGVVLKTIGTHSITATDTVTGTITGSQSGITVIAAVLHHLEISPVDSSTTAGGSQTYSAVAFDLYGNSLGDVTLSTIWSINSEAGGSFTGATYTSQFVGAWAVTGTYGGIEGTASLTVNHAPATTVSVSPASANLTVGQSQSYTALATDFYGNAWDATADISAAGGWDVSVGAGGQWNGATYTSENPGDWIVIATLGATLGTSTLYVSVA